MKKFISIYLKKIVLLLNHNDLKDYTFKDIYITYNHKFNKSDAFKKKYNYIDYNYIDYKNIYSYNHTKLLLNNIQVNKKIFEFTHSYFKNILAKNKTENRFNLKKTQLHFV